MLLGAFGSGRKEILARTPARDSCRPCRRTADRGTNDAGGAVGRSTVTRPSDHASADGDPDPVSVPWSIEKRRTRARVIGRRGPSPTGTTRAASRAGPRRKTATGRRVSPRKRRGSSGISVPPSAAVPPAPGLGRSRDGGVHHLAPAVVRHPHDPGHARVPAGVGQRLLEAVERQRPRDRVSGERLERGPAPADDPWIAVRAALV